ncbi:YraN family protein [Salegentibacter salinarum]|nr:YraN family protein [Salegentibacter salinarum]
MLARKRSTLVVVEVKTRSTPDFGDPQSFVKPKQIRQLVKAADFF